MRLLSINKSKCFSAFFFIYVLISLKYVCRELHYIFRITLILHWVPMLWKRSCHPSGPDIVYYEYSGDIHPRPAPARDQPTDGSLCSLSTSPDEDASLYLLKQVYKASEHCESFCVLFFFFYFFSAFKTIKPTVLDIKLTGLSCMLPWIVETTECVSAALYARQRG